MKDIFLQKRVIDTSSSSKEFFMVVILPQPEFIEVVFQRLSNTGNKYLAFTYSKRFHGTSAGTETEEWLLANGSHIEKEFLKFPLEDAVAKVTK